MPVELTIDHWNPTQKRYRFETFCYGPKSGPLYRAGPTRKVPGRKGMSWKEEDWVDEEATAHRSMDEQDSARLPSEGLPRPRRSPVGSALAHA